MNILRFIKRNVTHNETDITYSISSFSKEDVINLLSVENVGGGIFGFENIRKHHEESHQFFSPPHFKIDLKQCDRHGMFNELSDENKQSNFIQLTTHKSSMFPLEMNGIDSIWNMLKSVIPIHINILYQVVLLHKHDNWREQLYDEYISYLEDNLQQPMRNKTLRSIQRSINDKIDSFVRTEYRNLPIDEVEDKLRENGFRFSIRICLIGGTNDERKRSLQKFMGKLNKISYTNKWNIIAPFMYGDLIDNIKNRRLDNLTKNKVLCESELIPFLLNEQLTQEIVEEIKVEDVKVEVEPNAYSNSLISLLPRGNVKYKDVNVDEYVVKFNKAVKELGITKEFKLKTSSCGSALIQLTFILPKGVLLTKLHKKDFIDNLKVYMGVSEISILQSKEAGCIDVQLPLEERRIVYLRDVIETKEFLEYSRNAELGFIVGKGVDGENIFRDFAESPHALSIGQTNSGKSKFINQFLLTLLLTKKPSELIMYLIDIKQVEFIKFKDFAHVQSVITDNDKAIELFEKLKVEVDRRYKLLKDSGVENIYDYNKKYKNNPLSRILVVVDEYSELKMRNKNVDDYIESYTQLARACGLHVYVCSQRSDVNTISGKIKGNLNSKIVFKCSNNHSYRTALDRSPSFSLLGYGDGILEYSTDNGTHIRFQSCLITDEFESDLIKKIAKRMKEGKVIYELPEVIEVEEESDIEKLKRCIVQNNECRVAQLQKLLKININKLNELMKELCDEGFLKAPEYKSQGYKLIASEEEIERWKENSPQP